MCFVLTSDLFPCIYPGFDPTPLALGVEEGIADLIYRPFFQVVPNDGRVMPIVRERPVNDIDVPGARRAMKSGRFC